MLSRSHTNKHARVLFVGKREKKLRLWHKSPYDGVPGAYAAVQRFLYQIEGPSQLGDRNEPAPVAPVDPRCPVCRLPMKDHRIDRGGPGLPTQLKCPSPKAASAEDAN